MSKSSKRSLFGSLEKSESATSPLLEIIVIPDSPATSILSLGSRNKSDSIDQSIGPSRGIRWTSHRPRQLVLRDEPIKGCSQTGSSTTIEQPQTTTKDTRKTPMVNKKCTGHIPVVDLSDD
ncbi:hypothetical protein CJ030_MR7G004197 [Morella rubra]|uniref:Uncharacterized protein n=1 Tax=Morella rubra TaxID=262757 RepID=A0A6A1UXH0_9ROSI|nr:hypothetical protein CJ030_MR7G004196 [Morella rubra]KAB1205024.1 hypothetical protein CJ030_MR7G004197 [Morella rubra]